MKKAITITFLMIICLGLFFTQAFASGPTSASLKPNPTPGAGETPEVEQQEVNDKGPGKSDQHAGRKYNFKGEVTSFDGSVLVLSGKKGGTVTIDASTEIKVSGPADDLPTGAAVIQAGQQVMVQAVKTDTGFLALRVRIFPSKPAHIHRVGEVTAYQPGISITVKDKKGDTIFTIDPRVKILPADRADQLQVGAWVTIISPTSARKDAFQPVAKGIVVHPEKGNK